MSETSTPSWATVLARAIRDQLCDLHVALPGRVESYDEATQLADIKVMIQRVVETEDDPGKLTAESLPVLPAVPVGFLRAGGMFISFPVKKGDDGLLIFSERSLDRYRATGEETAPGDQRCHGLGGAIFMPGAVVPASDKLADAHADNLTMGRDGGSQIHIRPDDEIHLGSAGAADFVALAAKVLTELTAVATAFNAHVHPGVLAGAAVTGPPGPPPLGTPPATISPSSVAAAKVKAD